MADEHHSTAVSAFRRQAGAFARSPLHRSAERLRRLFDFMEPHPGERVLDVGCGPGIVTSALATRGLEAHGIDLTDAMIREALQADGGLYTRGDATRLPFRDESFDLTVCRNSLHHLASPEDAVAEMARVVRRGGRVVIEDRRAPDDPAKREYQETIERLRDVAHVRTLTRGEFFALAQTAGLEQRRDRAVKIVIDFDEWIDRAYPTAGDRQRALRMMEACLEDDRHGLVVWRDGGGLKFEASSLLFAAVRP